MKPFGTCIIDPPWPYQQTSRHHKLSGYSDTEYHPLGLDELSALPVKELADYFFIWTTPAFLKDSFDVIQSWGLEVITSAVMVAPNRYVAKSFLEGRKPGSEAPKPMAAGVRRLRDPATTAEAQATVGAASFFTEEQNGLDKEWSGRVWLNPPYSKGDIDKFVDKMIVEHEAGRVTSGIMLTHDCTDTKWFQNAARAATAMCFTNKRIAFVDTQGDRNSPTQGQTFFYFGDDVDKFVETFRSIGIVVKVISSPEMSEAA